MKKKMIIYMSKMSVGGMEKVLLNLLKQSNFTKNYDVTVYMLYSKENTYLNELKSLVKVKLLWKYKWNIFGKLICGIKMCFQLLKPCKFYISKITVKIEQKYYGLWLPITKIDYNTSFYVK